MCKRWLGPKDTIWGWALFRHPALSTGLYRFGKQMGAERLFVTGQGRLYHFLRNFIGVDMIAAGLESILDLPDFVSVDVRKR